MITHYLGRHLSKARSLDGWYVPGVISGHWNILVFNGLLYNPVTGKIISDLKPSSNVKWSAISEEIIVMGCGDGNLFIYANESGNKLVCTLNCNDLFSSSTSAKGAVLGVEIIVDSELIMITTEVRGVLFIVLKEGGGYEVVGQIIDDTPFMTHGFRHAAELKDKGVCIAGANGYAALFPLPAGIIRKVRPQPVQKSNDVGIEGLKMEKKTAQDGTWYPEDTNEEIGGGNYRAAISYAEYRGHLRGRFRTSERGDAPAEKRDESRK